MKRPIHLFPIISGLLLLLSSLPISADALATSNSTFVVDRLTDNNPGAGGQGAGFMGDFRYVIMHAQSGDYITFRVTGTIYLTSGLSSLTRNITIEGPGANQLTLDGAGGNVFSIANGATIAISGLTVTGGTGNGGGIFNAGTLTLNNCTISGNTAGDPTNGGGTGAGIWNYTSGILTLNNSTVSGNSVFGNSSYNPSRGGGIANYGTLYINNSTISGNSTSEGSGGGISNTLPSSKLTVKNSTISSNSAIGVISNGGGIDNHGSFQSGNSIIATNTNSQSPDLSGTLSSLGNNLIGNTAGGSGFQPGIGDLLNVNPQLGSLQYNGGSTKTMALLLSSPALDTGNDSTCTSTDQRGVQRGQGSHCDMGAYEYINPNKPAVINSVRADLNYTSSTSVRFIVKFSEAVTGVSTDDFSLSTTGVSGVSISGKSGADSTYIISVNTGTGSGTIRLNIVDNDSIRDASNNPLGGAGLGNGNYTSGETYIINKSSTFEDVPADHPFYSYIEAFYRAGITSGCSQNPLKYCPDNFVTRAEMAVFIERAIGNFSPNPNPTGMFADVPYPGMEAFTPFIEEFYNDKITSGCSLNPLKYCPVNLVTRGEMAVFIERAIGNFSPNPNPTGMFADVPYPGMEGFTPFIEEFYNDKITSGCSLNPLKYCPINFVSRGEMAVFIVRAFHLL